MAERSDSLTPPHNAPITPGETAMPPPQAAPLQVELQFNGNDNSSVTFKMKSTMKLKKAMEAYSARVQRPVDQLRFLFEGARLEEDDTPQKYEMTDGDIVDVHMEQIGGASDLSRDWVSVDDAEKKLKKAIFENGLLHALVASQKESIEDFTAMNQLLKADIDAHKKSNETLMTKNETLTTKNTELTEKASLAETTTQGMAQRNGQHVQLNRKLENTLNNTLAMVHVLSNDKFDMKATLVAKESEVSELKAAVATNECALGTLLQENRDLKAALAVKQRALDSAIQQNHDLHAAVVAKESALDSANMDNEALRAALDSANLDKEALHAAINSVNKDIDDLHATVITKELAIETATLDKLALECALDKGLEKQRVLKKTISKKERGIDSDLEEVIRSDSFLLDFDRS